MLMLVLGVYLYRRARHLRETNQEEKELGPVFTLGELKKMLENGMISQDEYESIKKTIIGTVRTTNDDKGR